MREFDFEATIAHLLERLRAPTALERLRAPTALERTRPERAAPRKKKVRLAAFHMAYKAA